MAPLSGRAEAGKMMSNIVPGVDVNGIKITPEQIGAEVQYHPAKTLPDAKYQAMQALVIRELLIQKAASLGFFAREEIAKNPDQIIDDLLASEISVPDPDEQTCRRYYENNKNRFYTSPLFEVSHILYLAPPEDDDARAKAKTKAEGALVRIKTQPKLFESIAKEESGCSSAKDGGSLGQISKSQTLPAFESALMGMREGEISAEPVATEVGYHIIKVRERAEGKQLPFESVRDWVADFLKSQSWQRAFSQYVQILAGEAKISGFRLKQADTPLVQ